MKKLTKFILKKYSQMSGDRKIRLGLSLSEMVRQVRKSGKIATGA
jgi:hypothetical protein